MKRAAVIAVVLGLAALAAPLSADGAARRFHGRALGNSPSGGLVPKHSFPVGAGYGLAFRDRRAANTAYRLCASMKGRRLGCQRGKTGRRGRDDFMDSYTVSNGSDDTGKLIWRWYVGGKQVARWDVKVTLGD